MTNNLKKLINNGAEFVVPQGDMEYSDFDFVTKTGNSITLDLRTYIEPTANFTINAPSIIEDGQEYILRVDSGATAYTMTLGQGIDNQTWNVDLTLQANKRSQFVFLGIDGELELQPEVVLSVNNKSGNVTVSEFTPSNTGDTGQVIKKTADGYEWANETGTTYTAGTGISISNGEISNTGIVSSEVSDTAYASSWDGVTTTAPSKNAVYDKISAMDTTIGNKANTSDVLTKTNTTEFTPTGYYQPATKKYVDDNISAATGGAVSDEAYGASWDGVTGIAPSKNTVYDKISSMDTTISGKQATLVSGTNIKTINNESLLGSGNISIQSGTTYTAGENIKIASNVISANNVFIITEDDVTVSTDGTKGVAPYNTSYGYTNIDISANAGIEWREGAIYTFVVNTEMVVASANRNVRVKIGNGAYIPVMGSSTIIAGSSYFTKANTRQYQYSTKYQSGGALHLFTDSNTTYSAMSVSEGETGTATTARTVRADYLKQITEYHIKQNSILKTNTGTQTVNSTTTSQTTPLGVKSANANSAYISFSNANGWKGSYGVDNSGNPMYYNGTGYQLAYKSDVDGKQAELVSGTNIKTINGNSILGSGDLTVGTDYSRQTKTISSGSVEIGLRTIVEPTSNFTLTVPSTLKDGEEYVIRCINQTSYTITLGTGFTNPRSVNLSTSAEATDQFVFIAIGGELELQPLVATGN